MKSTIKMMAVVCVAAMACSNAWAGTGRQDTIDRLQKSVEVLHAIMSTPDKGIPEEVLSNAKCILVVPDLVKGGFIVGGKHGRGRGYVPHGEWLERASFCISGRR